MDEFTPVTLIAKDGSEYVALSGADLVNFQFGEGMRIKPDAEPPQAETPAAEPQPEQAPPQSAQTQPAPAKQPPTPA